MNDPIFDIDSELAQNIRDTQGLMEQIRNTPVSSDPTDDNNLLLDYLIDELQVQVADLRKNYSQRMDILKGAED